MPLIEASLCLYFSHLSFQFVPLLGYPSLVCHTSPCHLQVRIIPPTTHHPQIAYGFSRDPQLHMQLNLSSTHFTWSLQVVAVMIMWKFAMDTHSPQAR